MKDVKKCPNCGSNLKETEEGYACSYCEFSYKDKEKFEREYRQRFMKEFDKSSRGFNVLFYTVGAIILLAFIGVFIFAISRAFMR